MSDRLSQFIAALIIQMGRRFDNGISMPFSDLVDAVSIEAGKDLPSEKVRDAIKILVDCEIAYSETDDFAGTFVSLPDGRFNRFVQLVEYDQDKFQTAFDQQSLNNSASSSFRYLDLCERYPILASYVKFGEFWLKTAWTKILDVGDEAWDEATSVASIPASDRIVSIDDNHVRLVFPATDELIDALEADNGLPEEPGFRERLIGQLKAGREYLRAGIFEYRLFHMSMVVGLQMLVDRYREHAIGAMASALLTLMAKQIGIDI